MHIKIAEAGLEDIWIVQSIADRVWAETYKNIVSELQIAYMMEMMYSLESLTKQISEDDHMFLLAKDNDEYVGFISYQLQYNGNQTKIHKIYVLPRMQGKHVGAKLISEVELIAQKNKVNALTLNVNRDNKAIHFYESRGFVVDKSEDIDIGNGFVMEDYVMIKIL